MATVAIAFLAYCTWQVTRKIAQENRLLRKAETEPKVIAYLVIHPQYPLYTNFILANFDRGAARNVKFNFNVNGDIDESDLSKFGIEFWNSNERTAISFLPQGEKISIPIGHSFLSKPQCPAFEVSIEYQDMNCQFRCEKCRCLEKDFGTLGAFLSGFHRLKVETMTAAEVSKKAESLLILKKEETKHSYRSRRGCQPH